MSDFKQETSVFLVRWVLFSVFWTYDWSTFSELSAIFSDFERLSTNFVKKLIKSSPKFFGFSTRISIIAYPNFNQLKVAEHQLML